MLLPKSTGTAYLLSFLQLLPLLLQLVQSESSSGDGDGHVQYKDCPEDIFEDSSRCHPPGIYYANIDGEVCQATVNSTNEDCSKREVTWQGDKTVVEEEDEAGVTGRKGGLMPKPGCPGGGGSTVITTELNPDSNCYSYAIPICEPGKYELTIVSMGGSDATNHSMCYDIKINDKTVPKVIYSNLLAKATCPRTEVLIGLKVNTELTELGNGRTQKFPLIGREFSLEVCFQRCGNESGTLQISDVSIAKLGRGSGAAKPCKRDEGNANCQFYNKTIPSKCWGRGCQFYQSGARCAAGTFSCEAKAYKKCICSHSFCTYLDTDKCSPDPPIFSNKLTCRRAKTYYVYHPKTHCYNEVDSGDCTAEVTYAVNLNGGATTDQRGVTYIADASSGWRDPHSTRQLIRECDSIAGVSHKNTVDLYANALVGDHKELSFRNGFCIYYPIPICQNGEYMMTIKMTEGYYDTPDKKCTEARINDVPVMIHMDAFTLSGNRKCGTADAVLMFLAEGEDEDFTLHLKGHHEPIQVKGGRMDLQFCIGYDCGWDINYEASAFTLERLGTGAKECKRKSR